MDDIRWMRIRANLMTERKNKDQFQLRLPPGMRPRLAEEAAKNASSINSEIIRAVRERFDRIDASVMKRKATTGCAA
jgi:predicted HicB family RNase H-like nuclease